MELYSQIRFPGPAPVVDNIWAPRSGRWVGSAKLADVIRYVSAYGEFPSPVPAVGVGHRFSYMKYYLNSRINFHLIRVFISGKEYKRGHIHDKYGGNRQSGISSSQRADAIFLFTGERGKQYGYEDGWNADKSAFHYSGEGIEGDMKFVRGNRAVRDHALTGKNLYLFKQTRKGYVEFVGQMVCTGWLTKTGKDYFGNERTAIIFTLTPIGKLALRDPTDKDIGERQA